MVLTAYVDNTWRVWRSATNSSYDGKFLNCVHSILSVTINRHVTLNQYCLLLLSTKDFASYCFCSFAYWCEIKGLQLLLFEHGCVDWWRYTFWMVDTGRHCICVMDDQFSTVSLWWVTIFGFSSCNPCKFKPAQFKFQWLNQMLWGKEINDEA